MALVRQQVSVRASVTRGFAAAIRESGWTTPGLSEMPAAVIHTAGIRPGPGGR
jgi:hypothetical protein